MSGGQVLSISDNGMVTSIGPKPMSLEELEEEVKKLNDLLQDPHPELVTWREAFNSRGRWVFEILEKLGFASPKAK